MTQNYRFSFCVWNKDLDYYMPECATEQHTFSTDEQAILAAETTIEEKLSRGMRKVHCLIEVMNDQHQSERFVAVIMRPKAEFRKQGDPPTDSGQTQFYKSPLSKSKKEQF